MYKTVLFDLDGTLLNTIDDLADSANRVCAAHGWPQYETAQYRYFVGNGIPKLVERFSPENARTPEQLAATLAEFTARYDAHKEDKTAPYPGIRSCWTSCGHRVFGAQCSPTRPTRSAARSSPTISAQAALPLCAAAGPACPPSRTPPGCMR